MVTIGVSISAKSNQEKLLRDFTRIEELIKAGYTTVFMVIIFKIIHIFFLP